MSCPVLSVLYVTFVHCGQTIGRIKMKLGMQVGLGPGHIVLGGCHVLAALSCYRLSHRDSTFVNWTAIQHLHYRCGLRDRTCVGPRRVSGLPGPVRAER